MALIGAPCGEPCGRFGNDVYKCISPCRCSNGFCQRTGQTPNTLSPITIVTPSPKAIVTPSPITIVTPSPRTVGGGVEAANCGEPCGRFGNITYKCVVPCTCQSSIDGTNLCQRTDGPIDIPDDGGGGGGGGNNPPEESCPAGYIASSCPGSRRGCNVNRDCPDDCSCSTHFSSPSGGGSSGGFDGDCYRCVAEATPSPKAIVTPSPIAIVTPSPITIVTPSPKGPPVNAGYKCGLSGCYKSTSTGFIWPNLAACNQNCFVIKEYSCCYSDGSCKGVTSENENPPLSICGSNAISISPGACQPNQCTLVTPSPRTVVTPSPRTKVTPSPRTIIDQCNWRDVECPNENYYVDKGNCNCQCGISSSSCGPGTKFNRGSCSCIPLGCTGTCPPGHTMDPSTCKCVCTRTCSPGESISSNCTCIPDGCPNSCTAGYTQNPAPDCRCACTKVCPSNATLDRNTCRCVPKATPPPLPFTGYAVLRVTTPVKCSDTDCIQPTVTLRRTDGTIRDLSGDNRLPQSIKSLPKGVMKVINIRGNLPDKNSFAQLTNYENTVFIVPPGRYVVSFDHSNSCPETIVEYFNPGDFTVTLPSRADKIATGKFTCIAYARAYWLKAINRQMENIREKSTKGLFSDQVRNQVTFFTQSMNVRADRYMYRVFNRHPITGVTSSAHFTVAYGHYSGYGADDEGGQYVDTPTRAVYAQYRNLILTGSNSKFILDNNNTTDSIYVLNYQKSRVKDELDPQAFELNLAHLSGSQFINGTGTKSTHTGSNVMLDGSSKSLRLITDYIPSVIENPDMHYAGKNYNIVSGSIEDGIYSPTSPHVYGKMYTSLRTIILDGAVLDSSASFGTVDVREVEGTNHMKLFTAISGAATLTDSSLDPLGMKARIVEYTNKNYYFMTAQHFEFNRTNNSTYVSGSDAMINVENFKDAPKSYITTVGLYNNNRELLAVGKFSKPILKTELDEANIIVKV